MTATYNIINADVFDGLAQLEDGSVHTCVTSPPYWGLRDYGTASWEGGDPDCDHKQDTARNDGGRANVNGFNGSRAIDSDKGAMNYRDTCAKCGARRVDQQLGLEQTPDEYVARMVEVFRAVRRVLRDDATLWLNLGDTYGSGKQLQGIPWRVAFALQADGWYLRQDIIWKKPNPMPESVRDRCTKAHEYIFLLSKSARYYFDSEAIAEPASTGEWDAMPPIGGVKHASNEFHGGGTYSGKTPPGNGTRNRRSVWTVTTKPYKGAHFATFPPDLIEPCILAGAPVGGAVLDPFTGSGTTAAVALKHGRNFVGTELNPEYVTLAEERIAKSLNLWAAPA